VHPTKVRLAIPILATSALLASCGGDDGVPGDATPEATIDASVFTDAPAGVVCTGALANYPGSLEGPAANDDGTTLVFTGALDTTSDTLRISAPTAMAAIATIELPDPTWAVAICVDDTSGDCSTRLPAYSGTLRVTSVTDRFQASLDRVIFVDSIDTPTCSASVSQSSIDVAILGPI